MTTSQAGNYSVFVSNAFGSVTSADAAVSLSQAAVSYLWTNSPTPTPPYTNWATAAHTIQDGMNNWQEWRCGTDPTNPLSVLRLLSAAPAGGNVTLRWQSVAGVNYFVARTENVGYWFSLFATNNTWGTNGVLVATNIAGQATTTTCTDTNALGAGPLFYRVGVICP